eukprot:UN32589
MKNELLRAETQFADILTEMEYSEVLDVVCENLIINSMFIKNLLRLTRNWFEKIQNFCFDLIEKKTEKDIYKWYRSPGKRLRDFVCVEECIDKIQRRRTKNIGEIWNGTSIQDPHKRTETFTMDDEHLIDKIKYAE